MTVDYVYQMQKDGVVKIPQVFNHKEIENLRRGIFETLIQTTESRQYHDGGHIQWRHVDNKRWPALLFWPAVINEELRDFRHTVCFLEVVKKFLGPNVRQMSNQIYLRLPGDGDEFNIHQDFMFRREIVDVDIVLKSYIQTIVAIDPVNSSNGGIDFFLGSHKAGLLNLIEADRSNLRKYEQSKREKLERDYRCVTFHLQPGDMLVWNLLVAHGSRENVSDRTRITYMNGFCDSAASESWPLFLQDGNIVALDHTMIPHRR
jgi:ectoine hydroxylase-related dioxygenase (phytanoyl-CoA dioxygenase family)